MKPCGVCDEPGPATPAEHVAENWRALHRGHFATGKPRWIHFFARCG